MKSGNKTSFKEMGSSPLLDKGDNLKRIMSEKKELAKKLGTYYKPGAAPNVPKAADYPKGFNYKGSNFPDKTPGYKDIKVAKLDKVSKKPTSTLNRMVDAFKNTPKQFSKEGKEILKTTNRNLISGGKQILKKGVKFLGGKTLGVAGMMIGTTSKADQPKHIKKSEGEQIKDLLTKHKLKGGRK